MQFTSTASPRPSQCAASPREPLGRTYIVSEAMTVEEFVGIICQALDRKPVTFRLPESALRRLTDLLGFLPRLPLTASRIDALTNRTAYSAERIRKDLGNTNPACP